MALKNCEFPLQWTQKLSEVFIFFEMENIEYPHASITEDQIYFKCFSRNLNSLCEKNFFLYEDIVPSESFYKFCNKGVIFVLKKRTACFWPTLKKEEFLLHDLRFLHHVMFATMLEDMFVSFQRNAFLRACHRNRNSHYYFMDSDESEDLTYSSDDELVIDINSHSYFMDSDESEDLTNSSDDKLVIELPAIKYELSEDRKQNTVSTKCALSLLSSARQSVQVNDEAIFKIIANDKTITKKDIHVIVETPNKKNISLKIFEDDSSHCYVKCSPNQVGTYKLKVLWKERIILVFLVEAYDINLIKYEKPSKGLISKPVTFEVDCSKAGEGELEILLQYERNSYYYNLEKIEVGKYRASFIPFVGGYFKVKIYFNGKLLKNHYDCSFSCYVPSYNNVCAIFSKEGFHPVNKNYVFKIENFEKTFVTNKSFEIYIEKPNGVIEKQNRSPVIFIEDEITLFPDEPGIYKITAKCDGYPVNGTPHSVVFYNAPNFRHDLSFYIPKIRHNLNKLDHLSEIPINKTAIFCIRCVGKNNNTKTISLKIEIKNPKNKIIPVSITGYDCAFVVEFTPTVLGNHQIIVRYNNKIADGTPFTSKVIR